MTVIYERLQEHLTERGAASLAGFADDIDESSLFYAVVLAESVTRLGVAKSGAEVERLVFTALAEDGFGSMKLGIRSAVRGLWKGVFTTHQFVDAMVSTLDRRLTQAWREGASQCGIRPDEMTREEEVQLRTFINGQIAFLPGLASDIINGSKGQGDSLPKLMARSDLWARQYLTAKNKGAAMACADQKMEWVLGKTEKHCNTCSRLSGKVKRMSFWAENVMPQGFPNSKLECLGGHCDCRLTPTTAPLSRGPLPKLP